MQTRAPQYDVIVIGGGPSGMMAAGRAAELGASVLLLEKNPGLGKKLLLTGGGRSNITNHKPSTRAFLAHFGDRAPFLHSLFAHHDVRDSLAFFHAHGMPTKEEAEGRVFPATERSETVLETLRAYLQAGRVEVKTGVRVLACETANKRVCAVTTTEGKLTAHAVILATGGLSHPETGSNGDGFAILRALGLRIVTSHAALAPVRTKEPWTHECSGLAFPDAKVTLLLDGTRVASRKGKLLFTHFGLSGPLILNMSSTIRDRMREGVLSLVIDLFPATDIGTLDHELRDRCDAGRNRKLKNVLAEMVPERLALGLCTLLGDWGDRPVHSLTKAERRLLAQTLKSITLTPSGLLGAEHAIVTSGGVPLETLDMKTMAFPEFPNLFVTGDLLDIDRPSGGYSLQLCWSTGWVAGSAAATLAIDSRTHHDR